ncbi:E3 ubiquitin-protein ligase UPL5-like [Papaver somniferum]|uniref:E3 ubiquitin-protein ligase UPL5-like n=1 Tax=Papaver somniferum TaxID=3469 RepID=UPI000E701D40|nr:E3 ubiquitin-protein ligase UPL5-like [Papaver somniferum]
MPRKYGFEYGKGVILAKKLAEFVSYMGHEVRQIESKPSEPCRTALIFVVLTNHLCHILDYASQNVELPSWNKCEENNRVVRGEWGQHLLLLKAIGALGPELTEIVSHIMEKQKKPLDLLILKSARSDGHKWILVKCNHLISLESRLHLTFMLLPGLGTQYNPLNPDGIVIDRDRLLEDSFTQVAHLNVQQLLSACTEDLRRVFPSPTSNSTAQLHRFKFFGRLIVLAFMHNVQVGIVFDRTFFLQLSGKPVSWEDVRDADPKVYKICKEILEADAEGVEKMFLTFTYGLRRPGSTATEISDLSPVGADKDVNIQNRQEYVDLYIQHPFVNLVSAQIEAFKMDFQKYLLIRRWPDQQRRNLLYFWTSVRYLPAGGFGALKSKLQIVKRVTPGYPTSATCFYRLNLQGSESEDLIEKQLEDISSDLIASGRFYNR